MVELLPWQQVLLFVQLVQSTQCVVAPAGAGSCGMGCWTGDSAG